MALPCKKLRVFEFGVFDQMDFRIKTAGSVGRPSGWGGLNFSGLGLIWIPQPGGLTHRTGFGFGILI